MNQRRKFRRTNQNLMKGDVLVNRYVNEIGSRIDSIFSYCLPLAHDVEHREVIRYSLIEANALIEAVSDIACWGSEFNCDEVHERVGAWREISVTLQKLADIQHL